MKARTQWIMQLWRWRLIALGVGVATWMGGCNSNATNSVLTPGGGTVRSKDQKVILEFPAGAVSESVGITIEAIADPSSDSNVISGTIYEFGPDELVFNKSVKLTVKYDASTVAEGLGEKLRLHVWSNARWKEISSEANVSMHAVKGAIHAFGIYALKPIGAGSPTSDAGMDPQEDVVFNEDGSDDLMDPSQDAFVDAVTTNLDATSADTTPDGNQDDAANSDTANSADGEVINDVSPVDTINPAQCTQYESFRKDFNESVEAVLLNETFAAAYHGNEISIVEKMGPSGWAQTANFTAPKDVDYQVIRMVGKHIALIQERDVFIYENTASGWSKNAKLSISTPLVPGTRSYASAVSSYESTLALSFLPDVPLGSNSSAIQIVEVGSNGSTVTTIRPPQNVGNYSWGGFTALGKDLLVVSTEMWGSFPVYVYRKQSTGWDQVALLPLSSFPTKNVARVATWGNRIVVADGDKILVFQDKNGNDNWQLETTIDKPPANSSYSCFICFYGLAMHGNRIVYSAPSPSGDIVHTYVYKFNGTAWNLETTLCGSDDWTVGMAFSLAGNAVVLNGEGNDGPTTKSSWGLYFYNLPNP